MEAVLKELDKEYMSEVIEEDEEEENANVGDVEATVTDKIKELNKAGLEESSIAVNSQELELKELGLSEGPSRSSSTRQLVEE